MADDNDGPPLLPQRVQLDVRTTEGDRRDSVYYVTSDNFIFLKGRTK